MRPLAEHEVFQIQNELDQMDASELEKIGLDFLAKQPDLYTYLLDKGEESYYDQDQRELLLFTGICLWAMISQRNPQFRPSRKISMDELGEGEILNMMLFSPIPQEDPVALKKRLEELAQEYVQPALLRYIIAIIFSPGIGKKVAMPLAIHLLTALDGFVDM